MIRRVLKNLGLLDPEKAPPESAQLERDGYAVLEGVFDADEVARMRSEIDFWFEQIPDERHRKDKEEFRYEMFNRSAACQAAIAHPRTLAIVEPLLGEDCHVIANTAWRNPPSFEGGIWHTDAGPHVPRPEGVEWPEDIPYPIFAVATHVMLQDCALADGPTAIVPGSHRSGRMAPWDAGMDLTYDGRPPVLIEANAGDVVFFVSDVWHRGTPARDGARGRFFLQVHYGRRDIAQRVRPTVDVNHVSPEAAARDTSERAKTVIGLHEEFFYDA
jgi:ectoine hydroxylase-related dioxygenase (phytanoyl-CoA dioxygenase family)